MGLQPTHNNGVHWLTRDELSGELKTLETADLLKQENANVLKPEFLAAALVNLIHDFADGKPIETIKVKKSI